MATAIKTPRPPSRTGWTGSGNGNGWYGGGGGGGNGRELPRNGMLGMWFALAAILMLFMGLTSAYIVRRGLDPDWRAISMPPLAAVNAVILAASSVTLEAGRRKARKDPHAGQRWFLTTWILGMVFVAAQLVVWRQLADAGLYLSTNAHSSFFYLLTALHGAHLLGGITALSWLLWAPAERMKLSATSWLAMRLAPATIADRARWTGVVALYWHFMDVLWVYLLVILFAWK